ncbi:hypothetical protein [Dactylosporangium sp. NPDC000521]|uniref:hypothetical protein n=1 Tax=Dactylosporangium sp. NPDC000521 TaxID=3363975 RepID=UPI003685A3F7
MSRPRRVLGFSWPVLVGLAALAAPRVVLHDLGVVTEGSFVNGLLVFLPPLCWIAAVLWSRPPRPFLTVLVIGALYGVFLAAGHQLLWDTAFDGNTPALGGNLTDLDPTAQSGILRVAAAASSLVTGAIVGAITGAVAELLCRIVPGHPERTDDAGR